MLLFTLLTACSENSPWIRLHSLSSEWLGGKRQRAGVWMAWNKITTFLGQWNSSVNKGTILSSLTVWAQYLGRRQLTLAYCPLTCTHVLWHVHTSHTHPTHTSHTHMNISHTQHIRHIHTWTHHTYTPTHICSSSLPTVSMSHPPYPYHTYTNESYYPIGCFQASVTFPDCVLDTILQSLHLLQLKMTKQWNKRVFCRHVTDNRTSNPYITSFFFTRN